MKHKLAHIILLAFLLIPMATPVNAEISSLPDYSILENRFKHLEVSGNCIIGISSRAVVVAEYDDVTKVFKQTDLQILSSSPVDIKIFDQLLTVKTESNQIVLYDLHALPLLDSIGVIQFDHDFYDYVLNSKNIFLTNWFDGVWQYSHSNYKNIQFADSTMKPILSTQIDLVGDTLFILDEYNGIIRYDISLNDLSMMIDYLFVPLRVSSFQLYGDKIILALNSFDVLFGEFDLNEGVIVDSIIDLPHIKNIFQTDTLLLLVSEREIELIHKNDYSLRETLELSDEYATGDVFTLNDHQKLALPNIFGGFTLHNIDDLNTLPLTTAGFDRPGLITDLNFYNGKLYTGGDGNPIDVFKFDTLGSPIYDSTISSGLKNVAGLEFLNDNLYTLYSQPGMIVKYSWIFDQGPPYIEDFEDSVEVDPLGNPEFHIVDHKFTDSLRYILIVKDFSIDVFTLDDSGAIVYRDNWGFTGRIDGFEVENNKLFVVTNKRLLYTGIINEDYTLDKPAPISLGATANELKIINNRLYLFSNQEMNIYDYSAMPELTLEKTIPLSFPVWDAVRQGDSLYTVSEVGLGVFDLTAQYPMLVDSGGIGGRLIDVDGNLIAVSVDYAIDFYLIKYPNGGVPTSVPFADENLPQIFSLRQNYPNPFNATTVLEFSIERTAPVELAIYNTLGQKVATLVDERKSHGEYALLWDGKNENGRDVASGIYLYRLQVGSSVVSKKMVLLK